MLKIFRNLTKKEWLIALIALVFIVAQVWLDLNHAFARRLLSYC